MKNFLKPEPFHYQYLELASGENMVLTHPYTKTKWLSINAWLIILTIIIIILIILPDEYAHDIFQLIVVCEYLYLISLQDKIEGYEKCMHDIGKESF